MQQVAPGFEKMVSEIVRDDYRTADVFKKYGINYCCGGNTTLEEACKLQNLEPSHKIWCFLLPFVLMNGI